jgi:hypothetical protein
MQALSSRFAVGALAALTLLPTMPAHAARAGAYHIFPTPDYIARTGLVPPEPAAATMLYYGGSVFARVKVVSVIWGPDVNPTTVSSIPGFSSAIVNSTFVDQLSQYDTFLTAVGGQPGTMQHIKRGTFLGQVQITPRNTSHNLTDLEVQKELRFQIKQGVLPAHDVKTLYMIYFPRNVTITLDNLTSCVDFGAYHFATDDVEMTKKNIFYTVEPDCGSGFSNITFAASHEYAEATTDNIPTPGSNPAFPQAWNTSDGFEIGDLCGSAGTLTAGSSHYTVTQVFLNSTNACSTGNYTSP